MKVGRSICCFSLPILPLHAVHSPWFYRCFCGLMLLSSVLLTLFVCLLLLLGVAIEEEGGRDSGQWCSRVIWSQSLVETRGFPGLDSSYFLMQSKPLHMDGQTDRHTASNTMFTISLLNMLKRSQKL